MKDELRSFIASIVKELFNEDIAIELTVPDEQFGDFATNAAMQLAKALKQNPREVAAQLVSIINAKGYEGLESASLAGPGFINFRIASPSLVKQMYTQPTKSYQDKVVVTEYSDPSSFKVLHAGHLYTSVVGDVLANLYEEAGARVHRVNFGGDVGLHVAKTMWAILHVLGGEFPDKLAEVPEAGRTEWMSARYVEGNAIYDDDEQAKAEIIGLNKRIYGLHETHDHDSPFAKIYWTCRQWSYDYFDWFYAQIGSHFERYYPESETMPIGVKTVLEQLKNGVYEESDGAIVFRGEKYGLHTRVFINSQGLPTYEAKDVGLSMEKWSDYHFDLSVILTDSAQAPYMAVVIKSIEQFAPNLANSTKHLTHGRVKLSGGQKMSSRMGNIVRAVDVLEMARVANRELTGKDDPETVLGAVKYAFLKSRLGGDVIYDPKESVSLEGNSGPYLQYSHARARSIIRKATNVEPAAVDALSGLEPGERLFARKLGQYSVTVDDALKDSMPHYIATYLYELAQVFNRFYEHNRVLGGDREAIRLALLHRYADVLKSGLGLLGITAPERM